MKKVLLKTKKPSSNALHNEALGPVEQVAIDLLRPYNQNARTHSQKQLAQIGASLDTFGWVNPILAEMDGTIIAGHGRWSAAKDAGYTQVPVIRIGHLTPAKVRAYRLADNRLAELAGWDEEMLSIEFQHLSSIDLDFTIETIGFDHGAIDMMIDPVAGGSEATDPADADVPEPQASAVTRIGDLWLLGKHRLLCRSALEVASFEMLMEDRQATMVFADAPYNCPVAGHVSGLGKVTHREFAMASGEMSDEGFRAFLSTNLKLVAERLLDGAVLALCMDWRQLLILQLAMTDAGLRLINLAVWVKTNAGMGSLYRSQHELVLIAKKGDASSINNVQLGKFKRYRTNVWRYPGANSFGQGRAGQLEVHPTCKPIPLVADVIRDVSNRGDIVLDSFMGSGTTLLAAERTGRIAYGMDIDPLYVDVTIRRWQAMTGKAATLAATGETFAEVTQRLASEAERNATPAAEPTVA